MNETHPLRKILGCSEELLESLHRAHCYKHNGIGVVAKWQRMDHLDDNARVVIDAWMLAGLMRYKFYDYLVSAQGHQLLSHPFRESLRMKWGKHETYPVSNTASYFTNMIIGSALKEPTADGRWGVFIDNIRKARPAVRRNILLDHLDNDDAAERYAAKAAKDIGIPATPAILRQGLDFLISCGIGEITKAALPSILPVIRQGAKYFIKKPISRAAHDLLFGWPRNYRNLSQKIDGRMEQIAVDAEAKTQPKKIPAKRSKR